MGPLNRTFRGIPLDKIAVEWGKKVLPVWWKKHWWNLISLSVAVVIGIVAYLDWLLIFAQGRLFLAISCAALFLLGGVLREQIGRILFR